MVEIILENREYGFVIGNTRQMPFLNKMAQEYTLLTQYYAVSHPSLPNYIAMIAGSTLGIKSDCTTCYVNSPNLADLIEASHRTWKSYQEDMPSPCFSGSTELYAQKHNPFAYFDDIRTNQARCEANIVPLTALDAALAGPGLPDFSFITPNMCNSGHDCELDVVDKWLSNTVGKIMDSKSYDSRTLIVVTFDEGQGDHSCCGLGQTAGGQVATVLISPLVKGGFQDDTAYSHYSVLKTIAGCLGVNPSLGRLPILKRTRLLHRGNSGYTSG